ncbi:MAG: hypothetical protein WDN31_11620 [Hyphomicrobium sp.]
MISIVLGLLIGFLILRSPTQSLVALSVLLVVFLMIEGVSKAMWALTIRPLDGWIWVLASGILGVVLSVLLILNIDTAASWLLALLIGIQLDRHRRKHRLSRLARPRSGRQEVAADHA